MIAHDITDNDEEHHQDDLLEGTDICEDLTETAETAEPGHDAQTLEPFQCSLCNKTSCDVSASYPAVPNSVKQICDFLGASALRTGAFRLTPRAPWGNREPCSGPPGRSRSPSTSRRPPLGGRSVRVDPLVRRPHRVVDGARALARRPRGHSAGRVAGRPPQGGRTRPDRRTGRRAPLLRALQPRLLPDAAVVADLRGVGGWPRDPRRAHCRDRWRVEPTCGPRVCRSSPTWTSSPRPSRSGRRSGGGGTSSTRRRSAGRPPCPGSSSSPSPAVPRPSRTTSTSTRPSSTSRSGTRARSSSSTAFSAAGSSGRPGALFLAYLGLYSLGRFWVEGLRTDSLMLGSLRVAQLVSVVAVVVAAIGIPLLLRRRPA